MGETEKAGTGHGRTTVDSPRHPVDHLLPPNILFLCPWILPCLDIPPFFKESSALL